MGSVASTKGPMVTTTLTEAPSWSPASRDRWRARWRRPWPARPCHRRGALLRRRRPAELEAAASSACRSTWLSGEVGDLPADADYVLHFAVAKTNDWEKDLAANSGGLAYLMEHHQGAGLPALLDHRRLQAGGPPRVRRGGPAGDNHGVWPFLRTYSICKIAAEGTARWGAERFGLPTTIARLSVPYGDNGGWPAIHLHMMLAGHAVPVHVDAPSVYHPLHADDILAMVPRLLAAAAVPAVTVNWGGSEPVSIEEWCTYLAGLVGIEARFEPTRTPSTACRSTPRGCTSSPVDQRPVARGHAPHGQGAAPRPGAVSARRGPLRRCDPEQPPASELLAAMRVELNDVYETFSRLDNPPLAPAELRPPDGAYYVGYEGAEAVAGGGLRRLGDGVAEIKRMYVRPGPARAGWPPRSCRARGRGPVARLRSARLDTGPGRCTRFACTVGPGSSRCRPTTTTPSPVSGVKRAGCDRGVRRAETRISRVSPTRGAAWSAAQASASCRGSRPQATARLSAGPGLRPVPASSAICRLAGNTAPAGHAGGGRPPSDGPTRRRRRARPPRSDRSGCVVPFGDGRGMIAAKA